MITLDAAQTWTVIAVLGASFFGVVALIPTVFIRVLRTEIGSVRTELAAGIGSVRAELGSFRAETRTEIASVRLEIDSVRRELRTEISSVNRRLDGMDRDIQTLMNREFGTGHP